MSDFLVRRDDLRVSRIADSSTPELKAGEALLRIDSFGLTANNVTYAVFGDGMNYWDFFPASEVGWGHVPMWGFAEVEASRVEGVEVGTRVYGYLPPASHLVVVPGGVDEHGFADAAAHRKHLPSAYQGYVNTATDPFYTADTEVLQMLLRPLFYTSFLIDDELDDDGRTESGPILISSASSKTSLAAAFLLAQRPGVEIIGLTSQRSRAFVEGLRIYSSTVLYDDIASIDAASATFVDVAGDAEVKFAVHSHFGDRLTASMVVGAAHWEQLTPGSGRLPGPSPRFFFAPDRIVKRSQDWGREALNDRVSAAWHPFCEWSAGWLKPQEGSGFDAVQAAYLAVLEGHVDPSTAHVLSI